MQNDEIAKKTSEIMHVLHEMVSDDSISKKRLVGQISTNYLKVSDDFFTGKICADLGCGTNAFLTSNLLDLGAKHVHALDYNEKFIKPATERFSQTAQYNGRWTFKVGTLLDLPYEDSFFDFVACQGVIHHTSDPLKSLSETARILKTGGISYITLPGSQGVLGRLVMELLRDEYQNNQFFNEIISNELSVELILNWIDYLLEELDENSNNTPAARQFLLSLKELIDIDLIQTIKDRCMAPTYETYTEESISESLTAAGFSSWYRTSKRPVYENIRMVLAPIYDNFKHPLARLLFGQGGVFNIVAIK